MNVLIIKISSMGDIIHTLPAITDASKAIPNIFFDWIIEETFAEIPTWHSSIYQVIPIKLRSLKEKWHKLYPWKEYKKCIIQLRQKKYDVIIDAQGLLKTSALITSFAKGIKHGMDYSSAKEPISCWFYNKSYFINKNQHAIDRIRKLFSYSLEYPIPSYIGQYNINHVFKSNINIRQKNTPFLIFLHSTTQSKKHWPELNWHKITKLALNAGYNIKLPFWTKDEESRANRLKQCFNQIILLPRLTLQEIAIQILKAKGIISVDTGLSHLAAALSCPNLTLYGPTDPKFIGTYGHNQIALRSKTQEMQHLNPIYVWNQFEQNFAHILK